MQIHRNKILLKTIFLSTLLMSLLFPFVAYSDYWSNDTYTHFSKNEPLSDMLEAMALDQDLPIIISENITDKISAYFRKKKAKNIFSVLQRTYGLVAYFDGDALYVYKNDEVMSKTITLNKSPVKFLEKALFDTGAMNDKVKKDVKWRINTKLNSVTFRGVQRFIDLTQNLAKKLNSNNYIYKWKDKKGRLHYSNDPPFGNEKYMDILAISSTSGSSSTYKAATNTEKKLNEETKSDKTTAGTDKEINSSTPPPANTTSVTIIR